MISIIYWKLKWQQSFMRSWDRTKKEGRESKDFHTPIIRRCIGPRQSLKYQDQPQVILMWEGMALGWLNRVNQLFKWQIFSKCLQHARHEHTVVNKIENCACSHEAYILVCGTAYITVQRFLGIVIYSNWLECQWEYFLKSVVRVVFSGEVMQADVNWKVRKAISESVYRQRKVYRQWAGGRRQETA